MLGHLPNLKSLCLAGLSNVKCISSSFYGLVNEGTPTVFPALERLELSNMPELAEWGEAECGSDEVKVFPRLKHFKIEECCKLMSVPTHFSSSRLQHLQILDTGLSDCLFSSYSNLSKLDIRGCPNLTKVPDCVRTLSSLEELNIAHCLNLETVAEEPSERQSQSEGNCSFTSLRILKIYLCPALVYLPCEMIGSSLENLSLDSLSSLENLPSLIDRLPNSPRLTFLEIVCVPKFMPSSSSLETWPLCSLKSINLNVSTGASMETVDAILQGCRHSLKWLRLTGMEIWKCLPQSIRHLTALHELTLENFGMEELPEWLGDLSSLRLLRLYNCKNLRHLSSMDAMRRLTRLEQLEVDGCTELLLTRSEETGSEWLKISHIPYIRLLFTPVWL